MMKKREDKYKIMITTGQLLNMIERVRELKISIDSDYNEGYRDGWHTALDLLLKELEKEI